MIDESKVIKDEPSVNTAGETLHRLPHGVTFRDVTTHSDDRGTVCEMFDPRWQWHPDPFAFAYMFTMRPRKIKGWGMHKKHDDRYFIMFGEMEIVMYDARPDSPTRGLLAKVVMAEHHRRLMNIPPGIWHANHNVGDKDVVVVNFPSTPYDHADPDKYRLPLDTDQIPYSFDPRMGW